MKGNKVPEKIYINSNLENRTWLIGKGDISSIEYTRTDAFIKKACKKLKQLMYDQHVFVNSLHQDAIIENFVGYFKDYVKGE